MLDIVIDFECRSRIDLSSCNAYKYAAHESTHVLCCGWARLDGEGETFIWLPYSPFPITNNFYGLPFGPDGLHWPQDYRFWASNAEFEWAVWNYVCVPRYGWPPLDVERIHCLQARASYAGLPRRHELVCKALGFADKGKDEAGHRNMLDLCKPKIGNENAELVGCEWVGGEFDESPAKHERNFDYCIRDVESEVWASRYLPALPDFERKLWLVNQQINQRGVPIDRALCEGITKIVAWERARLCDELAEITCERITAPSQLPEMKKWLEDIGCKALDLRAETVAWLLKQDDTPEEAKKVLTIRQLSGKSAVDKFAAILNHADADDYCRGSSVYHEAGTGRSQGRGVNFKNLKRLIEDNIPANLELADELAGADWQELQGLWGRLQDTKKGVIPSLAELVRFAVRAHTGKVLVVRDYSAIEFRVLHWLAGDAPTLDMIRRYDEGIGDEPYKIYASQIYGVAIEEVTKAMRQTGKVFVLGCGYVSGAAKFAAFCEGYGIDMELPRATELVQLYRRTFPLVKRLWYKYQEAALDAVKGGGGTTIGPVSFYMHGPTLKIRLPSGRELSYYDPKVVDGNYGPEVECLDPQGRYGDRRRCSITTWVENIDQAVSRDILSEHLVELHEDYKLPIVLDVYDEIVAEVREESADNAAELMGAVMTTPPSWAKGLPLAVSGGVHKRYVK